MKQDPDRPSLDTPTDLTGAGRHRFAVTAAAVLVGLGVFAVTLNSGTFINTPDAVLKLPILSHGKHIPAIFGQDFMVFTDGRYRPFSYALIAAVRTVVSADNVVFWHLWLVGFHVLNALLVYAVARRFTGRTGPPLLALAVFLLHPLASAFGNRMDLFHHVLGGSFYLGGFLCYLRYVRERKRVLYLLGLVLFACGLLTSVVVLTLPLLILLHEVAYERTGIVRTLGRLVPFGLCAVLAGYGYLSFHPHPSFYVYPRRINVGVARYWAYSFAAGGTDTLLALARGLSTQPPVSRLVGSINGTWNLACLLPVLVGGIVASVWACLRKRWFAVGVLLLFVGVLPDFGSPLIRTPDTISWSYRYLPLVGFALLSAAVVDGLVAVGGRAWRPVIATVSAIGVVVLGGLLVPANLHTRTATGYWQAALRENPRSELAVVALGKACLAEGREQEALTYLFRPGVGDVRSSCLAMARHYGRTHRLLEAAAHLQIVDREDAPGLQYQEDFLTKAEVMEAAGASDFAEAYLGWVVMADPHNTTALRRLAEIHARKGYLPAAVTELRAVAAIDPWDTENAEALAALEKRLYHPEGYTPSVKMTPPEPDWLRYVSGQGNTVYVNDALIRLAESHPTDPIIQLGAGILLASRNEHQAALRRIDRALEMMPSYAYAWATKCWAAANAGDTRLFLTTARGMDPLTPRDATIWHFLAFKLMDTGQYDLVQASLETALKADPYLAGVYNDLGVLMARQGQFDRALGYYQRALELAPDRTGRVENGLGYVLQRLGRPDEAMVHFRKSIAIDAKSAAPYRNIAQIFEDRRRLDECSRVLSQGLEQVPNDVGLRSDLAKILAAAPED
ncbi:MAG TPA: tetratricopeptide repeat protein, partial [Planctomycetota bacterium]|nr:tetratricopeptide repeat protein [Planctomycetota bacterium]